LTSVAHDVRSAYEEAVQSQARKADKL
jgi:hypothetical protein